MPSSTSENKAPLAGQVAVVTGGTQGLGAAIAILLAERGAAAIVICGRNQQNGRAQAQRILERTGVPVEYVPADLAVVDDCRGP